VVASFAGIGEERVFVDSSSSFAVDVAVGRMGLVEVAGAVVVVVDIYSGSSDAVGSYACSRVVEAVAGTCPGCRVVAVVGNVSVVAAVVVDNLFCFLFNFLLRGIPDLITIWHGIMLMNKE
jgi:hypothetical protein